MTNTKIKCKFSKEMTQGRCIKNQIEAEEEFGDRARECCSCPCEVGLELRNKTVTTIIIPTSDGGCDVFPAPILEPLATKKEDKPMARKPIGTCTNCERPNMAISNARGSGICGSCKSYIAGTKPGSPERESQLKEVKKLFSGKRKIYRGRHKKDTMEGKPEIKPENGVISPGSSGDDEGKVEENTKTVFPNPGPEFNHELSSEETQSHLRTIARALGIDPRILEEDYKHVKLTPNIITSLMPAHAKVEENPSCHSGPDPESRKEGIPFKGGIIEPDKPNLCILKKDCVIPKSLFSGFKSVREVMNEHYGPNCIVLHFQSPADHKLREAIEAMAKQYRRTPDQQILWLCQMEIDGQNELLKEAEGSHGI